MHFYDLRGFLFFVVIIFPLNFAFCGEPVYLNDVVERQEPRSIIIRRSESISSFTPRYGLSVDPASRFFRKREVQIPSDEVVHTLAVGENVAKVEPVPNVDIGNDIKNKTVKKQLKKQEDGTDITQTPQVKNSTVSNEKKTVGDPGAKTRGFIVFGSLGLLSFAYLAYKIYSKRKRGDLQQFKYGVLAPADADERLELADLPLALHSEDEETDIFDLERQRHSDEKEEETGSSNERGTGGGGFREVPLAGDDDLLDLREGSEPAAGTGRGFLDVL